MKEKPNGGRERRCLSGAGLTSFPWTLEFGRGKIIPSPEYSTEVSFLYHLHLNFQRVERHFQCVSALRLGIQRVNYITAGGLTWQVGI